MRIAIITVSRTGVLLAKRLADSLEAEVDIFAKSGTSPVEAQAYEHLGQLVARQFHQYDGFIFITSVSLAARIIAPHVRNKRFDPAVVVVDEAGNYAISLLAGICGVNELARQAGKAIGAKSIITSVTEGMLKPAVDLISIKLNAVIEPFEQLGIVNSAIANGERVLFFLDSTLANTEYYHRVACEMDIKLLDAKSLIDTDTYDAAIVITDKEFHLEKPHVFLRPATLAIGIDCKHSVSGSEIFAAVSATCKHFGRSIKCIAVICSSAENEEVIGLLATAQQMEVPIRFVDTAQVKQHLNYCGLKVGSCDLCEATALVAGKAERVIGRFEHGNVKVAIAEIQSLRRP